MKDTCDPCGKIPVDKISFLSSLMIMILPKCAFCVMAYSSAIAMCGGPDMYLKENNWASYIPLGLSVIIISMLFLNWRGSRTKYALTIAIIGFGFILLTHQLFFDSFYYYIGAGLLFFGIWFNGSFYSILSKFKIYTVI